jgi:hypothetical protein
MNAHAMSDSAALAAWHANTARSASAYVATAAARVGASRCAMSPVSCRMRSISCAPHVTRQYGRRRADGRQAADLGGARPGDALAQLGEQDRLQERAWVHDNT